MGDTNSPQNEKLDVLISSKQAAIAPKDGRLEVALAVASISSLVTVDASAHPFTTYPDDVFDRTFNDKGVGISDDQMAAFKANLTRLLPEIATDISHLPETANHVNREGRRIRTPFSAGGRREILVRRGQMLTLLALETIARIAWAQAPPANTIESANLTLVSPAYLEVHFTSSLANPEADAKLNNVTVTSTPALKPNSVDPLSGSRRAL